MVMNTVTINGVTITGGRNISVINGKIKVDGKDYTPADAKEINIVINGNVDKLEVDACDKVTVTGDVSTLKTMSGDVDITGDVKGDIKTMSGDVDCGNVGGSISTMSGDVKNKK